MIERFFKPVLLLVALTLQQNAWADDCDFTKADAFGWQQVVNCFESVPFDHDQLENIIQVLSELRGYSDMDELYDERFGWRDYLHQLDDPTKTDEFSSDFAMHNAIRFEHKRFLNPHVRYLAPACYVDMLAAYMPFDFGITTRFSRGEKQIVFIEDAPILPELYEQVTGIDPMDYVGMKVVAINGLETLEYFREFGRTELMTDDLDGTHLNSVLNRFDYTVRSSAFYDFVPPVPEDEMVLQSRNGKTVTVRFPWIFVKKSLLDQYQVTPTANQQEFAELCKAQYYLPFPWLAAGSARLSAEDSAEMDPEKAAFINRSVSGPSVTDKDYFEVPPGRFDREIEEIVPLTNSAKVLQYRDTTAIRFFNTGSWIDVAREGVEHACQNSDNLILDLRRNGGGNDVVFQWLYTHLFPEVSNVVEAGKIVTRVRNDVPAFNEALTAGAYLDDLFNDACWAVGPGCWMDIETEQPIPASDYFWNQDPSIIESRGGADVSLSREIGIAEALAGVYPTFDAASCPGKFEGDNLIILTDGTNCSGGYFFASPFIDNDKATVVTMGGYLDEEMSMGICRSGLTLYLNSWAEILNIAEYYGFPVSETIPSFNLNIRSLMETFAAYRQNRVDLHFNQPMGYDLRLDVWSDSPETDAYVYQKAIEAVKAKE